MLFRYGGCSVTSGWTLYYVHTHPISTPLFFAKIMTHLLSTIRHHQTFGPATRSSSLQYSMFFSRKDSVIGLVGMWRYWLVCRGYVVGMLVGMGMGICYGLLGERDGEMGREGGRERYGNIKIKNWKRELKLQVQRPKIKVGKYDLMCMEKKFNAEDTTTT
ncbi:hypothetical protein BDW02DRAFT_371144 [Decorospora gaudefroyi]|uniref:Uncharacterized protein n=1 Tax=Decorospora gaudefroyi TaxID=184978 RepID=A0A6A5KCC4_9PLEO|nr:hypothetical protein BDW02DRAFT_371144 [Decorospora gaudefroyi]